MEGQRGDQDRDSNARERQQLSVAAVELGTEHRQCSSRAEPCSVLAAASFLLPGARIACLAKGSRAVFRACSSLLEAHQALLAHPTVPSCPVGYPVLSLLSTDTGKG